MRENRTYGLMRGRAYPERDAPPYFTSRREYAIMRDMRALRNFKSNRCYHLISRIANRTFFLTDEVTLC